MGFILITLFFRRGLHIKAAKFLEAHAHKCAACGGGDFIQSISQPQFSEESNEPRGSKASKRDMVLQTNLGVVRTYQHKPGGAEVQSTKRRLSVAAPRLQPSDSSSSIGSDKVQEQSKKSK